MPRDERQAEQEKVAERAEPAERGERAAHTSPTEHAPGEAVDAAAVDVPDDDEPVETPFDHPLFLPVILLGLSLWFFYDGFINQDESMLQHLTFNRGGFAVLSLAAAWFGYKGIREMRQEKERKRLQPPNAERLQPPNAERLQPPNAERLQPPDAEDDRPTR